MRGDTNFNQVDLLSIPYIYCALGLAYTHVMEASYFLTQLIVNTFDNIISIAYYSSTDILRHSDVLSSVGDTNINRFKKFSARLKIAQRQLHALA